MNDNVRFREANEISDELEVILRSEKLNELLNSIELSKNDVLHGDLALRNILINSKNSGQYQLIDFETFSFGDGLWDFVCLFELISNSFFDRDGYSNIAELRFTLFTRLVSNVYGRLLSRKEMRKVLKLFVIKRLTVLLYKKEQDNISKEHIADLTQVINEFSLIAEDLFSYKLTKEVKSLFGTYYV